eukprot:5306890-Prymnesium_polylepis.1
MSDTCAAARPCPARPSPRVPAGGQRSRHPRRTLAIAQARTRCSRTRRAHPPAAADARSAVP